MVAWFMILWPIAVLILGVHILVKNDPYTTWRDILIPLGISLVLFLIISISFYSIVAGLSML